MERWLPIGLGRSPEPRWGAIDRFLDYDWDRLVRPLVGLPYGPRDYGLVEPAVDVFETEEHMVVKAELPGMDPKNLEVKVTEDSVAFRGETTEEREDRHEGFHWRERRHGLVQRMVPLARKIDPETARASFRHGVLTIRAAKAGSDRGRTVEVDIDSDQTGYGDKSH
ncbi:MAG: Hsp20/alpha crystallin family protein [Bacillota bacterium]|jgi:HSP20 family protein